jgi:hypothetical protein
MQDHATELPIVYPMLKDQSLIRNRDLEGLDAQNKIQRNSVAITIASTLTAEGVRPG